MRKRMMILLIIAMLLAACGQTGAAPTPAASTQAPAPTDVAAPTQAPAPTNASAPTSAPAYPAPKPAYPAPGSETVPTPASAANESVDAALLAGASQRLARQLGIDPEKLTFQSALQQEWPDGAMGCPEAGKVYNQAIQPGFQINFSDGKRTYAVHTTLLAAPTELMIWCDNQKPVQLMEQAATPQADALSQPLVDLAIRDLATKQGVNASDIKLAGLSAVEWNDSSLGCPKAGRSYMQVITPGYLVSLEAGGQRYEYHTDARNVVVLCDPSQP